MVASPKEPRTFLGLLELVEALRGPNGCPWDKEQTHRSLTPFAIEEAHELAEAIEDGNQTQVIDELGDVLLQVVLHSEIARQEGRFDVYDVIENLVRKMVRRHPHVFGDAEAKTSGEVLQSWAKIKEQEKADALVASTARAGQGADLTTPAPPAANRNPPIEVTPGLPALMRAQKIGSKTKKLRFDWADVPGVWGKVEEEVAELKAILPGHWGDPGQPQRELGPKSKHELEHELGDVLFSLAQLARHLDLEAEQCLRVANQRFLGRFTLMCRLITEAGHHYEALKPVELEQFWARAKAFETAAKG